MSRQKRTLALDFDGVLHAYQGYQGGLIQGPIEGSQAAVERLLARGHTVVVFTTRPGQVVRDWLAAHGFPPLEVTDIKRPFFVIVDDRALTFTGAWTDQLMQQIEAFKPYWWQQQSRKGQG